MTRSKLFLISGVSLLVISNIFSLLQSSSALSNKFLSPGSVEDHSEDIAELKKNVSEFSTQIDELKTDLQATKDSIGVAIDANTSTQMVSEAVPTSAVTYTKVTREDIIYLGSGESNSREWTDLSGTVVSINSTNYPGLKSVVFEASMSIVGGEVHTRVKNNTSGNVIRQSELLHNTSTTTWTTSPTFMLDSGSNDYVVQIISSSGEIAQLDGSRLRITYEE